MVLIVGGRAFVPPLYDYQCRLCGKVEEKYAHMDEMRLRCNCGEQTDRLTTVKYNVIGDVDFVTDNITGEPTRITSRKQMKKIMKEHGVMEKYGKGWT